MGGGQDLFESRPYGAKVNISGFNMGIRIECMSIQRLL